MTKEEAIKVLSEINYDTIQENVVQATNMAIQALEQQPCTDAISRAEAIRIASGYCHYTNIPDELAKLPSVNPKPCEDAISREMAIEKMRELYEQDVEAYGVAIPECFDCFSAIKALKELPSVTPLPCEDTISRQETILS